MFKVTVTDLDVFKGVHSEYFETRSRVDKFLDYLAKQDHAHKVVVMEIIYKSAEEFTIPAAKKS